MQLKRATALQSLIVTLDVAKWQKWIPFRYEIISVLCHALPATRDIAIKTTITHTVALISDVCDLHRPHTPALLTCSIAGSTGIDTAAAVGSLDVDNV